MTLLKNVWGPAYAGVGGMAKKMWEMAIHPGHYPFMVGAVSSFLVISAIPVSGHNDKATRMRRGGSRGEKGGERWRGAQGVSAGVVGSLRACR